MADNTAIEWTDATWNPVTGCTKVSPGCDRCYAETFAERWRGIPGHHFENGFDVTLRPERLDQPLRWRRPRRIFVNSMSDLFHESVPDEFIARVFAVMAQCPQHTFQVLTKRHGRMRALLTRVGDQWSAFTGVWPLPNVWLGVSVENQQWADIRIPALLDTPAAVRWLSCEPLLGPVDLTHHLVGRPSWGEPHPEPTSPAGIPVRDLVPPPRIGWVVVGGESGHGARPMHPDWARSLRDQCTAAGVPYFFKQHGGWAPIGPVYDQHDDDEVAEEARWDAVFLEVSENRKVIQLERSGHIAEGHQPTDPRTWLMARVGKKAAGRELDGRTWDERPRLAEVQS